MGRYLVIGRLRTNNKIKLLKRSAFGFRKHEHLFARIYWMQTPAVHSI
ncbi:hypothetical protein E5983_08785 [Streptococcus danieliae]|uniref:Transposase IS204/IS1001/IS1096/IS1165 DDE domain-containing protein n=1 Tax=Streptococcus danieliae TaxID=747656 RepID=A0A7X3GA07_9STRE|nr:hypothetical protein [Streptococcus danieliae]